MGSSDNNRFTGLIQVYTGDGKGKTTAAVGAAVRFTGNGGSVLFVQFLKGRPSGELDILKRSGVTVKRQDGLEKFYSAMSDKEKEECKKITNENFAFAVKNASDFGMIIFDEMAAALNRNLLDKKKVIDFIKNKPEKTELILTGRNMPSFITDAADYHSHISAKKHPFTRGVSSRKGIEY
ncbi:MAG: cob(I)yrinic acid a,c-diamide adenosyltransferase [Lachnospiraceae bacterium]|nr:cob(I)yrinic acid a,c-diamide adenosyltransferase [Lachnospiraceae bacterium]